MSPALGDAHKARLGVQFGQIGRSHVAHAGAQSTHQLVNIVPQISFVGYSPFDTFRHQFAQLSLPA